MVNKLKDIDKKTIIIVAIAFVAIIGLFVLSNNIGDRTNDKSEVDNNSAKANPLLESGQVLVEDKMLDEVPKITFAEFKKALKAKKVTVVMLGTSGCYWCVQQTEILRAYLYENKDVNLKYLDLEKLTNDEYNELKDLHSKLESFGTPTFIAVKGGKVVNVDTNGARGYTDLTKMLTEMGAL